VTDTDKAALRKELLEQRRSLEPATRRQLSARIASHVCQSSAFATSRSIAAYLPVANEVDCLPVIETAWCEDKTVALPVIQRGGTMQFFPYASTTPLRRNFFGIEEPAAQDQAPLPPERIDLVLLPLVGFDSRGYRLGMGGGYYDRYFAWHAKTKAHDSVTLLGLAYDFQRLDEIRAESWDIPLHGIVTESGLALF